MTPDELRDALKADGWRIETDGYQWKRTGVEWTKRLKHCHGRSKFCERLGMRQQPRNRDYGEIKSPRR